MSTPMLPTQVLQAKPGAMLYAASKGPPSSDEAFLWLGHEVRLLGLPSAPLIFTSSSSREGVLWSTQPVLLYVLSWNHPTLRHIKWRMEPTDSNYNHIYRALTQHLKLHYNGHHTSKDGFFHPPVSNHSTFLLLCLVPLALPFQWPQLALACAYPSL